MYTTIRHELRNARKPWPGTLVDPYLLSVHIKNKYQLFFLLCLQTENSHIVLRQNQLHLHQYTVAVLIFRHTSTQGLPVAPFATDQAT